MQCVFVRFLSCFVVEFGHCHLSGTSCHLHSVEFSHSFRLACKYWKQPKGNAILGNVGQYSCVQIVPQTVTGQPSILFVITRFCQFAFYFKLIGQLRVYSKTPFVMYLLKMAC